MGSAPYLSSYLSEYQWVDSTHLIDISPIEKSEICIQHAQFGAHMLRTTNILSPGSKQHGTPVIFRFVPSFTSPNSNYYYY